MSSTLRGTPREASDYYVTPQDMIATFLKAINEDQDMELGHVLSQGPLKVLDPCAGGDAEHEMAYPKAIREYSGWRLLNGEMDTMDIRTDSLATIQGDFLTPCAFLRPDYDVVITNPPFSLALPIIKKALEVTIEGGLVIMLLRLNFFGSKARQAFFHETMPVLTYVHTKRPKFLNTGGTDSIEYMHAVWRKGTTPKFTALRVI